MDRPTDILIDTDIGGDIDDALALALALNSPELNVVGITTVYLGGEWRVGLTREFLRVYGREDIPVIMGAQKPLCGWWDDERTPPAAPNAAAERIVRAVEDNAALTLAAIGPLTNVAAALTLAPGIAGKTRLLLMGGMVTRAQAEWNIACDPEAARIVFESGMPITMVGLDVTNRCTFTHEDIDLIKRAGNPRTGHLGRMLDTFLEQFSFLPVLHDPLALSALLWDDVLTWRDACVRIETRGEFTRGVTVDADGEPNARVASGVDAPLFKRRLLERLVQ